MLKFLFITIAVIWLILTLVRYLLPWAMRKMAQKVMGETQRQYQGRAGQHRSKQERQQRKRDGELNIDYMPPKKAKNGAKDAGEFVDFEEVKSAAK